jgi:hypothetical protein
MNADERRYQEIMMRESRANYVMYDVEVLVTSGPVPTEGADYRWHRHEACQLTEVDVKRTHGKAAALPVNIGLRP